jgi:Icc-related predicted phosphoesterase
LFQIIRNENPEAIFFGGDLLPNDYSLKTSMEEFVDEKILSNIKLVRARNKDIRFFIIFGNDDPRIYEKFFLQAEKNELIDYVHNKTKDFGELYVSGYSYVPPTPFHLKDWEKYDVSRFVDVGSISPESGRRTVDIPKDEILYSTIAKDLENLSKNAPIEKTIFLFHSPPYKSNLDRSDLDGKMIDHAPVDIHLGSIAIQRFIKKKHPLLTLHGHVHESTRLTGLWKEKYGKTYSFNAAHDGPELAVIRFDSDDLENASRELIDVV